MTSSTANPQSNSSNDGDTNYTGESSNDNIDSNKNSNVIINYLPQTMTQDEVRSLFSSMGELETCKLVRDKSTGQSLGYAFVNYLRDEDAQRAVSSLNGLRLQNKTIKVSLARPSNESIKGANLYVSGLPKYVTQTELEAIFRPFGSIITSKILCDNVTGLSKGVGFVRFDRKNEAEIAISKLSGKSPFPNFLETIQVKFANSPIGSVQKAIALQMAQSFVPLTMLQSAATVQAAVANGITTRKAVNGAVGGPIYHTSQMSKFRYSPLAGVPMVSASSNGSSLSSASSGISTNGSTSSTDLLSVNAALFQMAAAAGLTPTSAAQFAALTGGSAINVFPQSAVGLGSMAIPTATTILNTSSAVPVATNGSTLPGFSLFVYNLLPETEDSMLWKIFGPFGAVLSVRVIKDFATNKCKGYGFVTMSNYEEAFSAVSALNGVQLGNRTLQVSFKS